MNEALFSIESDLEPAFKYLFETVCKIANVYLSRERTDAKTPRVELKVIVGQIPRDKAHVHNFNDGIRWAFDTWTGTRLKIDVVTQREANGGQHTILLGKIRAALQIYSLVDTWPLCGAKYQTLTDIREAGSQDTVDSENNLDTTTIIFELVTNIRTDVWPE